jgi:hypothetical protein
LLATGFHEVVPVPSDQHLKSGLGASAHDELATQECPRCHAAMPTLHLHKCSHEQPLLTNRARRTSLRQPVDRLEARIVVVVIQCDRPMTS